ncbi:hypothetical protein EUGRSUZ_G02847 [Eucalyptus grandis]|uniref:Uncharacterized protein n=2 Tax=Eucalyptus grandis TaxID=71139 RepID=A0A059BHV1_EUCGR|nr:hypothetical protein EUGRSUZ_G02847 [Eucalyptus grandis]
MRFLDKSRRKMGFYVLIIYAFWVLVDLYLIYQENPDQVRPYECQTLLQLEADVGKKIVRNKLSTFR